MKQITIIMSLAISIFVLSGCNGKDDDKNAGKEECDKKGADWIWNVTEKKCEEAAATKEDCDKKGTGWMWDEANKKCNQKTAGLSDKQKCEAKGVGWTWSGDKATDAGEEYKKCTKDLSMDCTDSAKPVVKNASPLECVASYYTIINSVGRDISYGGYGIITNSVSAGSCRSISKKEVNKHESFLLDTSVHDPTLPFGFRTVNICRRGGSHSSTCPSEGTAYEVSAGRTGFVITKVDKTVEELREMGCFRYIIEAEGPL